MIAKKQALAELVHVDDEVLMARFAAGHTEAFEALYDRYEEPLFSFCLRLIGDQEVAQDAFQDTFITVIEQRLRYRERGRFRSWLFTVAHNTCLDRARLGRRRAHLLELHSSTGSNVEASPEQAITARDELVRLLAGLPIDQREILLLHRYAGFSYAEIAEMTSTTAAAVKQKAYRALAALRSTREE